MEARITRWQVGLAALALGLSFAWILDAALRDPDVPFLTGTENPDWIGIYAQANSDAIFVERGDVPRTMFVATFTLDSIPERAVVEVRSLGELELRLNEEPVWTSRADHNWKRTAEIEVEGVLQSGENEVRATVANARGPALLQLRLGATETILETNPTWRAVGSDGRVYETTRVSDIRVDPQSLAVPATGAALVANAAVLGLLFALGAVGYFGRERGAPDALRAHAPEGVLGIATIFWLLVYVFRMTDLPVLMGFDIVGHLAYVDFLLQQRAIPYATDGWSMYHPPAGHALIALLVGAFELTREGAAARWLYRLPTFLAGIGNVWLVWLVARQLFERDLLRTSLAVGFAALLPMNLYMSAYVSNEPLHSFWVSASLAIACGLLLEPRMRATRIALLAISLGLAILTKFTALVAVPIVALFVAAKAWLADRASGVRALVSGGGVLLGVGLVGGWFYLRTWQRFGRPIVGNWDAPGPTVWWEQPGFHTPAYYTSFGQALTHPFFAGYASFWDGLYSTFWGDGLAAGMIRLSTRHDAWNYDFMTASYWLAFPATVFLALGVVRAARFAVSGSDLNRRLAMSLLVTFFYAGSFALFAITLQLPFYAQAKAFYLLSAIVPISLFGALGLAWVFERLRSPRWLPVRIVYTGWLTTLVGAIILTFLG